MEKDAGGKRWTAGSQVIDWLVSELGPQVDQSSTSTLVFLARRRVDEHKYGTKTGISMIVGEYSLEVRGIL